MPAANCRTKHFRRYTVTTWLDTSKMKFRTIDGLSICSTESKVEDDQASDGTEFIEDLLVEEISIDGLCGVY
jgi:mycofactocin precursor